ncbi:MAG: hypothetical protein QF755_06285 [Candidatus Peribacteraceae bacterium]|jgi:hypothetical protein|nr:hypothetical protein [Candidatus Peribacteraceae bacterium]HCI03439.1 hypothetical protein [Candidatus Peribacteria bacterium]|tara:strand:+ start:7395 stop:8021 length:627 start_codon:yes stop_codon:yes gene_type:complete
MTRFLLPLFALAILLTACGGGGGGSDCDNEYSDSSLSLCLPDKWIVMDGETRRQRGIPDETIVAIRFEEAISGQFPAVTVTRETMKREVSPLDYSEAGIRSVSTLPGYTLMDTKEVKIDREDVSMHVFTAQPISDEPARKFYQISTVKGNDGYTITAAAPLFIESSIEKQIESIVMSISFDKETEEAEETEEKEDKKKKKKDKDEDKD